MITKTTGSKKAKIVMKNGTIYHVRSIDEIADEFLLSDERASALEDAIASGKSYPLRVRGLICRPII